MNAEIDATIGPILQVYAEQHGVILSACEGDEPGVQMNLYRWVKGLGLEPRVLGNVKGLQDPYRNPTTQKGFAEQWGQTPSMVTSFADGSKISFEQAIVANATGFTVLERGMSRGLEYRGDVMEIGSLYDVDQLRELGGVVDYVVGTPLTKVYCLAEHTDPKQQHYLELYKMGKGPLYPFFIPYHLVHFEVPFAIARVALFRDSVAKPLGGTDRRGVRGRKARSRGRRDAGRRTVCTRPTARRWPLPRCRSADTCRRGLRSAACCGATSLRTRCSATTTSTCPRAGSAIVSAPSSSSGSRARRGSARCSGTRRTADDGRRMKVVIFCGGLGVRMGEETQRTPKPMIRIGNRPILWHIMRYYAACGHTEFILCLGYKGDVIKEYFLGYNEALFNDFVLDGYGTDAQVEILNRDVGSWRITFADTGMQSTIGERLKAIERYLGDDESSSRPTATGSPTFAPDLVTAFEASEDGHVRAGSAAVPRSPGRSDAERDGRDVPPDARVRRAHQRRVLRDATRRPRLDRAGR